MLKLLYMLSLSQFSESLTFPPLYFRAFYRLPHLLVVQPFIACRIAVDPIYTLLQRLYTL